MRSELWLGNCPLVVDRRIIIRDTIHENNAVDVLTFEEMMWHEIITVQCTILLRLPQLRQDIVQYPWMLSKSMHAINLWKCSSTVPDP